jgi:DMSO/TMAO reductase YedYZ molybdopterin-dependent catalytic subunit
MNGHPLSVDRAAPVRLVVPGWYECGCIKWMNEIIVVAEDAAATSQMQEHAGRTMQKGSASPCQGYQAATIDPAAAHSRGKMVRRWENQIPCAGI